MKQLLFKYFCDSASDVEDHIQSLCDSCGIFWDSIAYEFIEDPDQSYIDVAIIVHHSRFEQLISTIHSLGWINIVGVLEVSK